MSKEHTGPDREYLNMQAEIHKALSHPTRLEIVHFLGKGKRCVCEIVEETGGEFSNISRHLLKLKNAGIIEPEKSGTNIYYSLRCPCILNFFSCIGDIITERIQHDAQVIENK